MKLSKINTIPDQPPADVRFYWQDEPVNVSYYPHRMTKKWRTTLKERPMAEALADVLAGWDVEGEDGAVFQPDPSLPRTEYVEGWRTRLLEVESTPFIFAVLNAIADDFLGDAPAVTP